MRYSALLKIIVALFSLCVLSNLAYGQKSDYLVTVDTEKGQFYLLLNEKTPKHKENFLKLVHQNIYDSMYFHRVLKGFVVQGGDVNTKPNTDSTQVGYGDLGYTLLPEFNDALVHDYAAIGAARQSDEINPDKHSSSTQFYIVVGKEGAHHLDGDYTVFGKVIKGMEVVENISQMEVEPGGKPKQAVYMKMDVRKMRKKKIAKIFGYNYPEY